MKHKSKFKKTTPDQDFKVGDLVLLREGSTKIKPREMYIVSTLPTDQSPFILIRKLTDSIRPKLYKALPQELIHLPLAKPPAEQSPRRQAAKQAAERFKHCLKSISSPTKKWTVEDQNFDDDLFLQRFPCPLNAPFESDSPDSSIEGTINDPIPSTSDSCTSEDSSPELSWDDTPTQYTLSPDVVHPGLPPPSPIPTSTPFPNHRLPEPILPFTRSRINALSVPPLLRRPAFRLSRCDQAFLQNTPPQATPHEDPRRAPTKKTRIPIPTSPSAIDLHGVSDVSAVLPPPDALRRSSRPSNPPSYYGTNRRDSRTYPKSYSGGEENQQRFRKH